MKDYKDSSWLENNNWGRWGADDEIGALNELGSAEVLKAISMIKKGKIYDMETKRFKGMPIWEGHASFEMMAYGSASGRRNWKDDPDYDENVNWHKKDGWLDNEKFSHITGANTEIMICPLHMGTHIDGLCHATAGADNHWYNGFNEKEHWSDFGPTKTDATTIPPIIGRGVLLDVAGYKGVDHVEPNYGVTMEDIIETAKWEGIELREKDCVFVRCGQDWPGFKNCPNAGVTLEAARYMVEEKGAVLLGDDLVVYENTNPDGTMSYPGHAHPVHHYALIQMGVHLIECAQLDELAKDNVYEFCFILAPNKIKGGTGMFVRPLAIV